jgi:hypothetical protein
MENKFKVKDSGERQQFTSGMVRDTQNGKVEWDRIFDGPMAERWAIHLTKGGVKYPDVQSGKPNWTLATGDPEKVRFRKSAVRHFMQWLRGDVDEDHASAVFFNINGYEYVKIRKTQIVCMKCGAEFSEEKGGCGSCDNCCTCTNKPVLDSNIALDELPILPRCPRCELSTEPQLICHHCHKCDSCCKCI